MFVNTCYHIETNMLVQGQNTTSYKMNGEKVTKI